MSQLISDLLLAVKNNPNDMNLRLVLSDAYEEAGEIALAKAWRWMVSSELFPHTWGDMRPDVVTRFGWINGRHYAGHQKIDHDDKISEDIFYCLENSTQKCNAPTCFCFTAYASIFDALFELANAHAAWSKKHAKE